MRELPRVWPFILGILLLIGICKVLFAMNMTDEQMEELKRSEMTRAK